MLEKTEGRRRRGRQRMRWLDGNTEATDMNWGKLKEMVRDREEGGLACCSLWDLKKSDTTGQLNSNNRQSTPGKIRFQRCREQKNR